jgi:two-component system phosphate regulon sensor histidine kinase PhoR
VASLNPAPPDEPMVDLASMRLELAPPRPAPTEIIGNSPVGIVAVADDDIVLTWNPAAERITGIPAEDAVGRRWSDVVADGPPAAFGELELEGADGEARCIRYSSSDLDRGAATHHRVIALRDATAERRAEESRSDFVAAVAHELRAPLTPLKGYAGMLADGLIDLSSDEARSEVTGALVRQTERLDRLTADLLEAASIESLAQGIRSVPTDLAEIVHDQVAEAVWHEPDRSIDVVAVDPAPVVLADPVRVAQVVGNLVSNALKYSPAYAPVEIRVAAAAHGGVVAVTDRGDGIAESDLPHVFERFHRLDNAATRSVEGTGMGLYIARTLVEAMAGTLHVSSDPGRGSTFWFTLPLAESMDEASEPEYEVVVVTADHTVVKPTARS